MGGVWTDVSWRALGQEVRELALGLLALGRARGAAVGLLSQSRAEWVRVDFAILSAGCVTVPVYPTYPAEEVAYIVTDAGVETLFVEDAAQLDKVLAVVGRMPRLDSIVLIQGSLPAGPQGSRPRLLDWAGLRALGRTEGARCEGVLAERIAAGRPDDVATIVYTSGTTGHPKGVVQTHGNHLAALAGVRTVLPVPEGTVHLLFLPLAHAFARLEAFAGIFLGLTTAFAESLDKLAENMREVRPEFICGVPRVFEKVYARVLASVEAGSPLRKKLFRWALGVGRAASRLAQEGRPLPAGLRLRRALATRLVFARLHAAFGGRLRVCISGGAALAPEIAEFFHAAGIPILEGYGLTETCPILAANRLDRWRLGTVGPAYPGVELRIAEDGEILARGPNIARGYHNRPAETAAAWDAEGWFHTGDIGELDADGFLRITDRKKDLFKTASGSYVAPQHIENLLKADPLVSQAMVYGEGRPYPVALITLNPEELARVARDAGLGDEPAAELVRAPAVTERVQRIVDRVNAQLVSYARVKRFAVLADEFTQEGGELTPTLKVRRQVVGTRYAEVIESLYRES